MSINDERKNSIRNAISAYLDKQTEMNKPKRKNSDPEEQVAKACMDWFKSQGWSMQRVESKYKLVNGRWVDAGIGAGTADSFGSTDLGHAAIVEFKAPGKRLTLWREGNERQAEYLIDKIATHAFAVVVDSAEDLANWYSLWLRARDQSPGLAKSFLFDLLPRKPKRKLDESPLFD